MTLLERYILKITFSAFAACLVALTGVIWITQALRELDLLTGKGQTLFIFLTVTGLSLPALISVIAPVALFLATLYTLNRLNGDSELIVMSAGGMPPQRLLRPFLALATFVCLIVGVISIYLMPASFQELRGCCSRRSGRISWAPWPRKASSSRWRTASPSTTGRSPGIRCSGSSWRICGRRTKPSSISPSAARPSSRTDRPISCCEKGSVQRKEPNSRDSSIVAFERYAVDLSAFNKEGGDVVYKPRERSTTQLLFPDKNELLYQEQRGRFRAELHDRLSSWLYPLAMMMIAFVGSGRGPHHPPGAGHCHRRRRRSDRAHANSRLRRVECRRRARHVAVVAIYGVPLAGILVSLLLILKGPAMRSAQTRLLRRSAT